MFPYDSVRHEKVALLAEGVDRTDHVLKSVKGIERLLYLSPSITLKGLEYLQENSLVKKAAELAEGIAEAVC